jgi:predicted nucleotidyltransferase
MPPRRSLSRYPWFGRTSAKDELSQLFKFGFLWTKQRYLRSKMEQKAIPSEYKPLLGVYTAHMKEHFGGKLRSVCLFGSVARGCASVESDIDVLVVAEGLPDDVGMRLKETNYIHENLKGAAPYRSLRASGKGSLISDLFFTPEEIQRHPPILLDIVEDGILMYDKDDYLRNVLLAIRETLKKLGSRRVITKRGSYYWVLKPDIKPGEIVQI